MPIYLWNTSGCGWPSICIFCPVKLRHLLETVADPFRFQTTIECNEKCADRRVATDLSSAIKIVSGNHFVMNARLELKIDWVDNIVFLTTVGTEAPSPVQPGIYFVWYGLYFTCLPRSCLQRVHLPRLMIQTTRMLMLVRSLRQSWTDRYMRL